MRKTIATVVILGLVWIGYIAWPLYDLLVLVRAMETRDLDTVTRGVYFDAVRASLTSQVVAAQQQIGNEPALWQFQRSGCGPCIASKLI